MPLISPRNYPQARIAIFAMTMLLVMAGNSLAWAQRTLDDFPLELVDFIPSRNNPVFAAEGPGHWDVKIRERGWIMYDEGSYHLWFTGYDGTREGIRQLGYATSKDGRQWERSPHNPLCRGHWVEDMMVVKHGDVYYMFAEGANDQAQLLTSRDRIDWKPEGTLDIRTSDGKPLSPGPFGTPTAWFEKETWYLFYERYDAGVWLATSKDMKVWTNVQDNPVLEPGPGEYDKKMIALNQIIKYGGVYFAYYHGSGSPEPPRTWTTDVARSTDLVHWTKFPGNPLVADNKSSGILLLLGGGNIRLYTMHEQVEVYDRRVK